MAKPKAPKPANTWANRITREGEESPDQLLANPLNFRVHTVEQARALTGALGELGWVTRVLVNERTGHVIDGHLRVKLAMDRGEATVPVTYVDLSEEEERLALATLDPISAMAGQDAELLRELLGSISTEDASLAEFLADSHPDSEGGHGKARKAGEPETAWGERVELGPHVILCGDSGEPRDLLALLGDLTQGETLETVLALYRRQKTSMVVWDPRVEGCRIMEPSPARVDALVKAWDAQNSEPARRFPPAAE